MGLAIGALWGIFEWVYDQLVRPNAIFDLIMDSIGALAAGYVCSRMPKV
jgi:hypothetical protein